ncbi:unnamed protein product [Gongylonema pulchrum]|uniref:UTRA domain-containing protein n=1 Tax=Gongylonema pulchrum TaxID=637853 RepID=A0A183D756_9BILA|nr:unnamed protein product [Gongylonema pulchrum]
MLNSKPVFSERLEGIIEEGADLSQIDEGILSRRRTSSIRHHVVPGAEAFVRASSIDQKSLRSSHRLSVTGTEPLTTGLDGFIAAAEAELASEDKVSAGLITVYRNIQGNYTAAVRIYCQRSLFD